MGNDQWDRLEPPVFRAHELPTGDRAAGLDQACGLDAEFRKEVEAAHAGRRSAGGGPGDDRIITLWTAFTPPRGRELDALIGTRGHRHAPPVRAFPAPATISW